MTWMKKCMEKGFVDTKAYMYTIVFAFLLDEILFIHTYIGGALKLFIVWGFLVIGANLYTDWKENRNHRERRFWNKYFGLILLFILSYLVTIFVNRESYAGDNIKVWCYMIVFFFGMYGIKRRQKIGEWKKEWKQFALYLVVLTFILSVICLLTYIFGINIQLHEPDGYTHIGMYDNRLWGLYNPNVGSTLNVISMILSLGLLFETEKGQRGRRSFYVINLILQYCHLLLTGSRTSLATMVLGVAVFFFFALKTKKSVGIRILVSVAAAAVLMAAYVPVRGGLSYVPNSVKKAVNVSEVLGLKDHSNTAKKGNKVDLVRKEKEENRSGGFLTGRQYLWEAGIKALKEHPLFGISKAATYEKAKPYIEDEFWLLSLESSLHNSYITVLVASGIVGFLLFMAFLLLNVKDYLILAFGKEQDCSYNLYITLLAVIAVMMLTECLEGRIIYRTEVFNVLFWGLMGMASQYTRIRESERKNVAEAEK